MDWERFPLSQRLTAGAVTAFWGYGAAVATYVLIQKVPVSQAFLPIEVLAAAVCSFIAGAFVAVYILEQAREVSFARSTSFGWLSILAALILACLSLTVYFSYSTAIEKKVILGLMPLIKFFFYALGVALFVGGLPLFIAGLMVAVSLYLMR
jgi:hypothetical protein